MHFFSFIGKSYYIALFYSTLKLFFQSSSLSHYYEKLCLPECERSTHSSVDLKVNSLIRYTMTQILISLLPCLNPVL